MQNSWKLACGFKKLIPLWKNSKGRPVVVEVGGTPKAGKGHVITKMGTFLRRLGLEVHSPAEGPEQVPRYLRRDPELYNNALATYSVEVLLRWSSDSRVDLLLMDRGLIDRVCWSRALAAGGGLELKSAQALETFLLQTCFLSRIDIPLQLVCNPIVAMERENLGSFSEQNGSFMNPELLARLYLSFPATFAELVDERRVLDTSSHTIQETTVACLNLIHDELKFRLGFPDR